MKLPLFLIVFLLISACGQREKNYEDYDEEDFYEVQGIITRINPTADPFDSSRKRNIFYDYHLDMNPPLAGGEEGIDLVLKSGDPIVVLVHKNDSAINFFGRYGIIDERMNWE